MTDTRKTALVMAGGGYNGFPSSARVEPQTMRSNAS